MDTHTTPVDIHAVPPLFRISDAAAKRIAFLLSDEPQGAYFRIAVEGGGCSGFQYHFDLDPAPTGSEDRTIRHAEATVVIDETSLGLLAGSEIDYVESLGHAGFEIRNPGATARCGCGNSFSL